MTLGNEVGKIRERLLVDCSHPGCRESRIFDLPWMTKKMIARAIKSLGWKYSHGKWRCGKHASE
jgi:hypothetical protein